MPDLLLLGLFFFAVFGSIGIAGYLFLGRGATAGGAANLEAPESAREALTDTLLSIGEAVPAPKGAGGFRRKPISPGFPFPAAAPIYSRPPFSPSLAFCPIYCD